MWDNVCGIAFRMLGYRREKEWSVVYLSEKQRIKSARLRILFFYFFLRRELLSI